MKLVIVTNIMTPYRIPLFEALNAHVDELTILLMAKGHEDRHWVIDGSKVKSEVLPGLHLRLPGRDASIHWNYGVIAALRRLEPDVIISGGFAPANITAFIYSRIFGCKYVGWGELTLLDGAQRSVGKRLIRKIMTKWSDGSIASSSVARDAFLHYGAKKNRVKVSLMPIDVAYFISLTENYRTDSQSRSSGAGFSHPVLLSVGRLIRAKGYPELFEIYEKVIEFYQNASLIIVGDGKNRREYEDHVRCKGWRNVHFAGFVQSRQLAWYYSVADVFVFHSLYDPFGAVLSEAMAAGVPVVSSVHAAATIDLVEEGVTGFRIDPRNAVAAASSVLKAIELPEKAREKMVRSAFDAVSQHDYKIAALEMYTICQSVAELD